MGYDQAVYDAIVSSARRHNIDPAAALSVAAGEGGIKWGAVGDSGSSYGPFQLHVGGALPQGRDATWANSLEGVDYALSRMAQAGAAGLTGNAAVDAIIRLFERPLDPNTSVRNAQARLPQYGGAASAVPAAPSIQQNANLSQTMTSNPSLSLAILGLLEPSRLTPYSDLLG